VECEILEKFLPPKISFFSASLRKRVCYREALNTQKIENQFMFFPCFCASVATQFFAEGKISKNKKAPAKKLMQGFNINK
jgi:hypothetical protein